MDHAVIDLPSRGIGNHVIVQRVPVDVGDSQALAIGHELHLPDGFRHLDQVGIGRFETEGTIDIAIVDPVAGVDQGPFARRDRYIRLVADTGKTFFDDTLEEALLVGSGT